MPRRTTRRAFLRRLGLAAATAWLRPARLPAAAGPRTQPIPISGERVPVIGMGSWLTFDVPPLGPLVDTRVEVLRAFFAAGGGMIDSSPMYGHAEDVIGRCLRRLGAAARPLFAATKVWTPLAWHGRRQVEDSFRLWGVERFSLLQIHNMVSWEGHYETLRALQAEGRVRYVGITTSHGRRHRELETALRAKPFDFVQLTYNLGDREAEARLLPLAAERGIAVIANRPFRRGDLIHRLAARPLPSWAAEIDCQGWPQVLLKFVVSHPAVTCAIPATSDPEHMVENMGASRGRLPDAALRRRMVREVAPLLG